MHGLFPIKFLGKDGCQLHIPMPPPFYVAHSHLFGWKCIAFDFFVQGT